MGENSPQLKGNMYLQIKKASNFKENKWKKTEMETLILAPSNELTARRINSDQDMPWQIFKASSITKNLSHFRENTNSSGINKSRSDTHSHEQQQKLEDGEALKSWKKHNFVSLPSQTIIHNSKIIIYNYANIKK